MERLTIGELAKETGVKVVTIRYYEHAGLLPLAPRTTANYRTYGEADIRRLQFVRRCRELGFRLDQVRDLLRLSSEKTQACAAVDRITRQHLEAVQQKLRDLNRLAAELRRLSDFCCGDGVIADCRIIEALSPDRNVAGQGSRA